MAGVKLEAMRKPVRDKWMAARVKHGGYSGGKENPEHYVWRGMFARCYRPNAKGYGYYGGVGVAVCTRWKEYKNFVADMGPRPATGYSIERVDPNGDYEPANCVWATASQQQQNKRTTRRWECDGEADTLVGWAKRLGISSQSALYRMKAWGTFERGRQWRLLKTR